MRRMAVLCIAMSMGVAACGSATAPGGISVGGHWSVTITNLSGSGHVCNGTFTTDFAQSLGTFKGTYQNNGVMCVTNGNPAPIGDSSGVVDDGSVDGQQVSFALDNGPIQFTGSVNVSQMSGAVSWTKDFGQGPVTLSGSWTAQKQ